MADQHAVLAVLAECRPVGGDRLVELQPAALDLLPERDRGERLGAGEEREERVRADRFAALGVGVARGEVEDELAAVIDGERRAGEEPQRAELLVEEALDLGQRLRDVMLAAG